MGLRKKKMEWTDAEIIRSYTEAANREMQIEILADLNDCEPGVIREILHRAGIAVPKKKKADTPWRRFMLECGGKRYTVAQVAERHGKSRSWMCKKMKGVGVLEIDEVRYTIAKCKGG